MYSCLLSDVCAGARANVGHLSSRDSFEHLCGTEGQDVSINNFFRFKTHMFVSALRIIIIVNLFNLYHNNIDF